MAKRIMVIDDDQDVRLYLKTFFMKNGYEAETAKDGEEGLSMAKTYMPDLITLDILMPKKSGIRCYGQLREDENLKKVPVVVLTGLGQHRELYAEDFDSSNMPQAFVEKPIDQQKMLKIVRDLIG